MMQTKQYTIGEFASINKVSTRMLRHYDKIGLFKPAAILPSGYRAYTSDQISLISQIREYQSCGFTLSEAAALLQADEEQTVCLVTAKQKELRTRDAENGSAYDRLCGLLGQQSPIFENTYPISFTLQEERQLFVCETAVPEVDIEQSFDRLYEALTSTGTAPAGVPMLLSQGLREAVYRTAVPVIEDMMMEGFTCMVIPEGRYLSTLHFGDYSHMGGAYDHLLRYAAEQGVAVRPPLIERYFLDRIHTSAPMEYITEISVKITS